jgi:hypothetical protein
MVTVKLASLNQPLFIHSPFPILSHFTKVITLLEHNTGGSLFVDTAIKLQEIYKKCEALNSIVLLALGNVSEK